MAVANPEKVPEPGDDIITLDETNMISHDTTVRPMRESLRKLLKPPYNGQPYPPEVQAEIERLKSLAPEDEDDIITLDETNMISHDTTVRPMRESLRKLLKPPYNGQPFPPEVQAEIERLKGSAPTPQEPPPENPPS
jgi:hypothetical protein